MNHRQLPEQIAFEYRGRTHLPVTRRVRDGEDAGETGERGMSNVNREETPVRRRNVTMPGQIQQPPTWSERRARHQRAQSQQRGQRLVKRTLAQTGLPAPVGQVRTVRSLPRQQPLIPTRSGNRARRGSFWRRILGAFMLLTLGMVVVGFGLFSPTFHIQQVTVNGTSSDVLVRSIQQMGAQGQNIFLIDIPALESRIDALPQIARTTVQKQLPDQLVVSVVERLPVLLWQVPGATYSVDSQGVVIGQASATGTHLMSVVDMRTKGVTQQVRPGTHLNADDIAFALQVFERLPQETGINNFTLRYTTVTFPGTTSSNAQASSSFVLVSPQGWIAYLGSADDSNPLDNRLVELQQILNKAQQEQWNLATIDLRSGLRPTFTLKS